MLKSSIAFMLISLIAACAQPKTRVPEVSAAEIAAEREYQEAFLYEQDFSHIHEVEPTKRTQEKRLMRIAKRIGKATMQLCREFRAQDASGFKRRCLYDVDLGPYNDKSINAFADGDRIEVSRKMVQFLNKDEHLAFVLAHEFAHNMMDHLDDQLTNMTGGAIAGLLLDAALADLAGVRRGDMTELGSEVARRSYSPDYELEADYIGLYIMKRAGYNLQNAPDVWRMLAAVSDEAIYVSTTHPTSPERFVMMRKVMEEIKQKEQSDQPLRPEMQQRWNNEDAV